MMNLLKKYAESVNKVEEETRELQITCDATKLKYYKKPVVRVYNNQQAYFYLTNGVKPVEIYPDTTAKRIVFVFYKEETEKLYREWLRGANRDN